MGIEHKACIHQTETAIVDVDSDIIKPGDPVYASKSSEMGEIIVKAATSTAGVGTIRGFALKKTSISLHENEDYFPGELIPVRRAGEVTVLLDTTFTSPKIGDFVFLKAGKLVKEGKGGVQVGKIKDVSLDQNSKVVLFDVNIGP
ncbi:structural cement protein Gp24 [Borreliella andersonii]|uniref:structural cement protein Gp24 n=1 Tax=Borrelia andersonii TaxID=42109 RepID=UPI003AB759BF